MRRSALTVRSAACGCTLALLGALALPARATHACGADAPLVAHGDVERVRLTDSAVLAARVARRAEEEEGAALPSTEGKLGAELARALAAVRAASPEMAEIRTRSPFEPGTLIVALEPTLFDAVSNALPAPGERAALCTGHAGLDRLNAALGLRAVMPFEFMSAILVRFDPLRDVERAALSYAGLEGVTHVEPNFALGDGSDIEAAWVDGAWYLVFREAWGDCPSGCLYSALHHFIEREGEVERVAHERATEIATFARLVGERRWNHRPESP